ncbi:MAG TPA: hypothetical protein VH394_21230 [Thermoanaerobaculia bacterium]|jgi:hypothetical protein|nr:hypothetical protein [Thermoanaerobaculia bacterium]
MSMVQDEDSGLPGCDICQHPASMLFDEGVYLCTTHAAEARCLKQEGAHIEWSLTAEGLAALADHVVAPTSGRTATDFV